MHDNSWELLGPTSSTEPSLAPQYCQAWSSCSPLIWSIYLILDDFIKVMIVLLPVNSEHFDLILRHPSKSLCESAL